MSKKTFLAAAFFLYSFAAQAADASKHALMLDDNEVAVLKQLIDAAVKAQGITLAPAAVYFLNKLIQAPVVAEQKDDKGAAP